MEKVIECIEDIKEKINSQDYYNLYEYISAIDRNDKPLYKHEIYFNLKSSLTLAYEDGTEKEKEVNTSFREVFHSEKRIEYTFGMDMEIEYILVKEGINPFRMISNKNYYEHHCNCFKKFIKKVNCYDLCDTGNFDFEVEIVKVNPLE